MQGGIPPEYILTSIDLHSSGTHLMIGGITMDGRNGDIRINADGIEMSGTDYSVATIKFGQTQGDNTPVIEIRDKHGKVVFKSGQ